MRDFVRTNACRLSVCLAAVLLVAACAIARGETVQNQRPRFALRAPDGFVPGPASGKVLYMFVLPAESGDDFPYAGVTVERLGGTIGPEKIGVPRAASPGSRLAIARWKGFDLQVLVTRTTQRGQTFVGRSVQVPLAGEAVQINVVVPAEREATRPTADATLAAFLAGLDGPSNWPVPLSPRERAIFLGAGAAGILVAAAVPLVVWARARNRRRKAAALAARMAPAARAAVRDTPEKVNGRSLKYGVVTALTALPLLLGLGTLAVGLGPGLAGDAGEQGRQLMDGVVLLSCICGFAAFCIARVALTRRAARLPPPPPAVPRPAPDFDHIVDDST